MSNWELISKTMNRRYYDCQNKWNTIRKSSLKIGRFTPEEDEIIHDTVIDWDAKGVRQGLWVHLESLLGRRNDVIRKRWQSVLSKKVRFAANPTTNILHENYDRLLLAKTDDSIAIDNYKVVTAMSSAICDSNTSNPNYKNNYNKDGDDDGSSANSSPGNVVVAAAVVVDEQSDENYDELSNDNHNNRHISCDVNYYSNSTVTNYV